tara:strand:+ start:411 stop:833 length:423 start_codon:yes stop_codon:yes gene_type:complete
MEKSQSAPNLGDTPAKRDRFGTRSHRCNARPINPFEDAETPEQELLSEVFQTSGWKRDGSSGCKYQAKILASLEELGPESPYAKVRCEESGITAVHACAVNGYTALLRALVEKGGVDPLVPAIGLSTKISWVKRQVSVLD